MKKALIPIILFAVMVAGLAWALMKGDTKTLDFAGQGKIIPAFEQTELFDEARMLTEADVKGEISIINVFGTWCPPCAVEHPVIMDIAETGRVRVIGLAWQRNNSREDAVRWLKRLGDPYELVIFVKYAGLVSALGVTKAPETYLLDKSGRLIHRHDGQMSWQVWEEDFLPLIAQLESQ